MTHILKPLQIKIYIILCFSWSFFLFDLHSQDVILDNYTYLESKGEIPRDFTLLSYEKFRSEKAQLSKTDSWFTRKTKEQYLLESNYVIDEILLSGKILFNDPLSEYINNIADELLKNSPELRSFLRFYVTKSPSVNAFATDKGIIFINIGLIAQVEDEAQLAFVIAHEIVHYVKKHGMEFYLEKENIANRRGNYKRLSMDEQLFAVHHRSREMENEADETGFFDFFLKSSYSLGSVDGLFDVLQYAYLPFDDITFTRDFFETPFLKFPDSYYLNEIRPISGEENYDDSKCTHPNIIKRRITIGGLISNHSNESRKAYVQPREKFIEIRELARFEAIRQYIINRDYGNAVYNSYLLLKDHPDNKFLETSIATGLYCMAKYKIDGILYEVLPKYTKIEGESQQLYFFLEQLSKDEFPVFALQYCWRLKTKYPDNEYLKLICDDLIKEMVQKQNISLLRFSSRMKDSLSTENKIVPDSLLTGKYDRIRNKRLSQLGVEDDFIKYAFVEALQDTAFKERFAYYENTKSKKSNRKYEKITYDVTTDDYEGWGIDADSYREELKEKDVPVKNIALGLDRVIILDPVYVKIDMRKKNSLKFIHSEISLTKFYDQISRNAQIAHLDVTLMDSKSFRAGDIIKYNEFSLLYDWFTEKLNHGSMKTYLSETANLKPVFEKYNTSHLALVGVVSSRIWKENKWGYVGWSFFFPYALPWSIYYAVSPDFQTVYYYILYNGETGEDELVIYRNFNKRDRLDIVNSVLYDTFFQIIKDPAK